MRRVKFKVVRMFCGVRCSAFISGEYSLDYPKGATVRAREGTLGVAIFKTKKHAKMFTKGHRNLKIIHVRPIGRGRSIKIVCDIMFEHDLVLFYRDMRNIYLRKVPPGTIFYPAVEVLD